MAYPASITALINTISDASGTQPAESYTISAGSSYQYRLGSAATPALPAGWQLVPKGAFALPAPNAISAASTDTTAGGGLVAAQTYQWALTNSTRYGETTAATAFSYTVGASGTGVLLTLPSVTASTANPVILRRLYRTKQGGTQLYYVADIPDLSLVSYLDRTPDSALTLVPPASNASGVSSPVSVTGPLAGGGTGPWTEVAPGTSLVSQQYIVDYTYSGTGGLVTFAAADATKVVTITYTAATLVNPALVNALIGALKDLNTVLGTTPQGTYTDVATRLTQNLGVGGDTTPLMAMLVAR